MSPAALKDLYERAIAAMTRRPELAQRGGHARVRPIEGGLASRVDHEDRSQRVDVPREDGGRGRAPDPGQLMRASVGACLAMGYRIWAARLELSLDAVDLEISCGTDARGQLGIGPEVPVGWAWLRVDVTLTSSAPEEALRRLMATTHGRSPMLANLSPAIRRIETLTVVRPSARPSAGPRVRPSVRPSAEPSARPSVRPAARQGTARSVVGHASEVKAETKPTQSGE